MIEPGVDQPPAMMSIDVEDWFHVENLSPAIPRETWSERQLRVERNMDRMLQLMADAPGRVRASCFVLGWVAERCPSLIRRIAAAGHEIASHGHAHELVDSLSVARFRADVERSKSVLEDLVGVEVRGYRAPSFSITEWAIPVLLKSGSDTTHRSSPPLPTIATGGSRDWARMTPSSSSPPASTRSRSPA
jgi:polysaccharide deacetylase family protein (PEP-CTERM system associated)